MIWYTQEVVVFFQMLNIFRNRMEKVGVHVESLVNILEELQFIRMVFGIQTTFVYLVI